MSLVSFDCPYGLYRTSCIGVCGGELAWPVFPLRRPCKKEKMQSAQWTPSYKKVATRKQTKNKYMNNKYGKHKRATQAHIRTVFKRQLNTHTGVFSYFAWLDHIQGLCGYVRAYLISFWSISKGMYYRMVEITTLPVLPPLRLRKGLISQNKLKPVWVCRAFKTSLPASIHSTELILELKLNSSQLTAQ